MNTPNPQITERLGLLKANLARKTAEKARLTAELEIASHNAGVITTHLASIGIRIADYTAADGTIAGPGLMAAYEAYIAKASRDSLMRSGVPLAPLEPAAPVSRESEASGMARVESAMRKQFRK